MAERSARKTGIADPSEAMRTWADLAERGRKAFAEYLRREAESDGFRIPDPAVVGKAFLDWGAKALADPSGLLAAQAAFWRDYAALVQAAARGRIGQGGEPVVAPEAGDRRFKGEDWDEQVAFDFLRQAYLLAARSIQGAAHGVKGLDPRTARKVEFYTRQFVDAMAPSNFVMTNPTVLRATLESGGANLLKGLDNLLKDLERGRGRLDISMTDYDAFRLGENIAATPGKVVYQNELMQLLQYAPATETVYRRPLLIVPPWINKFYILDLQPKNSFINWVVNQGHTLFVISWVNPDRSLAHKTFEDYMVEGPLAALEAIESATGEPDANVIGYCIGGTLTATALAYMAARGGLRVKSATFLTTMVDFAEPGDLAVFIDEEQLAGLERHMDAKGYLEGRHMATVFNLMRANDLIWLFVVNNYLLGRDPLPFDLLYWNADSTRMPAMMHRFYLRKMYHENRLVEPGGLEMRGVPIDLRRIAVPAYLLATREDHIAPWKSTYAATRLYSGPVRFVLSSSGHIAGVINPPSSGKYGYWTNPRRPKDPEAWLRRAAPHEGSWWSDWAKWIARFGAERVPARAPGDGALPPLEDAPGSYVKVRLSDE
ncbi:MAG: PHA/PHB synthase family protein [Kiloniellaceae bacterium]